MSFFKRFFVIFGLLFMLSSFVPSSYFVGMSVAQAQDQVAEEGAGSSMTEKILALDQYFINFILNVREPLVLTLGILSWLLGVIMVVSALIRVSKPGFVHGKGTPSGTFAMLIIGAMLVSLPATIKSIEQTIFKASQNELDQSWSESDLSYMKKGGEANERVLKAINAAFQYIRILGLIAFIRGLYLLKTAVDGGQASILMASMHLIGGVLAMNVAPVVRIFHKTVNG